MKMFSLFNEETRRRLIVPPENYSSPLFGVELEVEGDVRWDPIQASMRNDLMIVPDGSLRGPRSGEVVFLPKDLETQMRNVRSVYRMFDGRAAMTARCSTHVHANVLGLGVMQIMRLCVTYAAVEPWLVAFAGPGREFNHFCVPWMHGNHNARMASTLLDSGRSRRVASVNSALHVQGQKYSALNLRPVATQGTVEFRLAPAFHNPDQFDLWLSAVAAIRSAAENRRSLQEIIRIIDEDHEGYARDVLPRGFMDVLRPTQDQIDRALQCVFLFFREEEDRTRGAPQVNWDIEGPQAEVEEITEDDPIPRRPEFIIDPGPPRRARVEMAGPRTTQIRQEDIERIRRLADQFITDIAPARDVR